MKHKIAIYYDRDGDRKCFRAGELNKDKATIAELKRYDLFDSTEVNKPYARFDIFGVDKTLSTSKKHPEIIIEVVDTCFHNADLFNFLIEETKKTSLIVMYYFIPKEKTYNAVRKIGNNLEFRISCYIKNGIFFYCGIPVEIPDHGLQKEINNLYRKYNFIEQEIIKPIKAGRKIDIANLKRHIKK
jgi:hypothetical protein